MTDAVGGSFPFGWLALATVALAGGPMVERASRGFPRIRAALDGGFAGVLSALVTLHIVPDASEVIGGWAWVLAAAGLVAPALTQVPAAAGLVGFGLAVHAVVDGAALAVPTLDALPDRAALALAVVVHRLPVGLLMWTLAGGRWRGALGLGGITALTAVGCGLASRVAWFESSEPLAAFQAVVGGSLVHVLLERSPLSPHPGGPPTAPWVGTVGFAAGAALTLALPEHGHGGAPSVGPLAALTGCALLRRGPRDAMMRWLGRAG